MEPTPTIEKSENNFNLIGIDTDSFIECVSFITNISKDDFQGNIDESEINNWYKPHTNTLYKNGYDMIFYSYRNNPIAVSEENPIERYSFPQLPMGTCVLLCVDGAFNCHSVVATTINMPDDNDTEYTKRLIITYEPNPERPKVWVVEIGFFIKTFMTIPEKLEEDGADG